MTDSPENGESPLLEKVMTQGESTMAVESLDTLRDRVRQATLSLPDAVRSIHDPDTISVQLSSQLDQLNRNY
jgi:hypothetical protein